MEYKIVNDDFLTELLDVLETINNKATSDGDKELMYNIMCAVKDSLEFTND